MDKIIAENKSFVKRLISKRLSFHNEDLEQEVYIKAWKNIDKYQEDGKLRHWLAVITANVCNDYFRSSSYKKSIKEASVDEIEGISAIAPNSEDALLQKQRQKIILHEVYQLPKDLKQAIILYEFEDLTYEEIAQKTKTSLSNVKNRLHQARKILSIKLKDLKG